MGTARQSRLLLFRLYYRLSLISSLNQMHLKGTNKRKQKIHCCRENARCSVHWLKMLESQKNLPDGTALYKCTRCLYTRRKPHWSTSNVNVWAWNTDNVNDTVIKGKQLQESVLFSAGSTFYCNPYLVRQSKHFSSYSVLVLENLIIFVRFSFQGKRILCINWQRVIKHVKQFCSNMSMIGMWRTITL